MSSTPQLYIVIYNVWVLPSWYLLYSVYGMKYFCIKKTRTLGSNASIYFLPLQNYDKAPGSETQSFPPGPHSSISSKFHPWKKS